MNLMFKLRFLFPIVALIAISDALPHTDEQLMQEHEQAKQEQIKLARRIAKLERRAVALDAEQTSRETSGRNIEIIVGVIALIKGKRCLRYLQ
jgi:agmatine/peptidylarginine deiminase